MSVATAEPALTEEPAVLDAMPDGIAPRASIGSGQYERWKGFAEGCMAEYDLDGWKVPDLVNPDDVSAFQ